MRQHLGQTIANRFKRDNIVLAGVPSILLIDDHVANVTLLTSILARRGYGVRSATSGRMALQLALEVAPDLIILDVRMPDVDGYEVCRQLKSFEELSAIPVIFVSGLDEPLDKVKAFSVGGVDYVTKPFHAEEILARVDTHLRLRSLQQQLESHNRSLQKLVQGQLDRIVESHLATIFALAKLAEYRDDDTGKHLRRVQGYCEVLASHLSQRSPLSRYIDDQYIQNMVHTAPLHDIGKVGIPDAVLLKPAPLTPQERQLMQTHTRIGAATLEEVLRCDPENRFINMGVQIARSHHEHFDGSGYPEQRTGESIPLSARILCIADHYDALRNKRPYKKALDHATVCAIMLEGDGRTHPSHFDPVVLRGFSDCREKFAQVFDDFRDAAIAV